jgi:hypothetical protein
VRTCAHIIFRGDAWIVVQRSTPNSFGDAVSPMNLTYFVDVKKWAIEKFGEEEERKNDGE